MLTQPVRIGVSIGGIVFLVFVEYGLRLALLGYEDGPHERRSNIWTAEAMGDSYWILVGWQLGHLLIPLAAVVSAVWVWRSRRASVP